MRGLAALLMLSACRFGFDPSETTRDASPTGSADAMIDAATPTTFRIDVILLTQLDVCLIGDSCANNCISIQNAANVDQVKFANNANFHAVPPGDPRIAGAAVSRCMRTTLDAGELVTMHDIFGQLASNLSTWSGGTLALDVHYEEVTSAQAMGLYNMTVWLDPSAVPTAAAPALSTATDFVFLTNDILDDSAGLHMTTMYCGLAYGTDNSPSGYPYVWIPWSNPGGGCAGYNTYRDYLMGGIYNAIRRISTFTDAYNNVYPACGAQTVDPTLWFPDPGQCSTDPDFAGCGTADCGPLVDSFHEHLLGSHWVRDRVTTLNHCRDGVLDFGETDIDTGGPCP